jgi:hypothetical protein
MSNRATIRAWFVVALILFGVAIRLATAQSFPDTQAVVQFQRAADDYAFWHRRIERRQPSLAVTADAAAIRRAVDTLAAAIRAGRADAREGDLFTAPLPQIFRARILRAMRAHELTVADLEVGDGSAPVALAVNSAMPWHASDATPPCVLEVLPPLPPELQYRFVGADLLLVDVHASLIVDILRDAAIPLETIR